MSISLLTQLESYHPLEASEAIMTVRLKQFLETNRDTNPFERRITGTIPECGHVTGSAWVIDSSYSKCILLHHAKLGKWVQPGGHCDGETDVCAVAQREATEETGLQVNLLQKEIFDIDIHEIPEYWNTPAHLHFDVRYLFVADPTQPIVSNHESRAVRWVSLEEARILSGEETVVRMVQKTKELVNPEIDPKVIFP